MALIDRDWAENSLCSRNINTFSILLLLGISLFHWPVMSEERDGKWKKWIWSFQQVPTTHNKFPETKQEKKFGISAEHMRNEDPRNETNKPQEWDN